MLYTEVLHSDIGVNSYIKIGSQDTFKHKIASTLDVNIFVNPFSTLNVKIIYIKSKVFTLRTGKCKKSTLSVILFYIKGRFYITRCDSAIHFIQLGSKVVKRLRSRQYDPVIIERTIGLVLDTSTTLYRLFLKHCSLNIKAMGTIRDRVHISQETQS